MSDTPPERVTLKETTVGQLGPIDVGSGNFWERDFDVDGASVRQMSARLAPFDGDDVTVRVGSTVTVGGAAWRVVGIDKTPGENGQITLERVLA